MIATFFNVGEILYRTILTYFKFYFSLPTYTIIPTFSILNLAIYSRVYTIEVFHLETGEVHFALFLFKYMVI